MAVSKAVFIGLSLVVLVVGVVVGFLIGYFTYPEKCESGTADVAASADSAHERMHFYNHAPGPCKLVDGIDVGSEDVQVVSPGLAIITSGITIGLPADRPDLLSRKGTLKLFDFNDPDSGAADIPIVNEDDFDYANFNPHGISVWREQDTGPAILLVVNHNHVPDKIETVERFEFDEASRSLRHIQTISADDETMFLVNDVIATGPDTFYYTNYVSTRDPAKYSVEIRDKIPGGSIGYFDGERGHLLGTGLRVPNGINMSPDGKYVYVAVYGDRSFNTYRRDADNGLTLYKSYDLHSGPDNLDVDADGYVWIGCHPDHDQVMKYLVNPDATVSPSQALRLKVEDGIVTESVEVYMDDGAFFSGCTVAVRYGEQLLIGSVYTKAVYCEAKYIG